MSSAVSSTPSGPGWVKVQAHCWASTRTTCWSGAVGRSCFTWYQTRTAKKTMNTSHTSTSRCGMVIQRFSLLSSPVTYWAPCPSRLRKRKSSPKKTASETISQKPTSQKISVKTKSISAAEVEAAGRMLSIMPSSSQDEEDDDGDEAAHQRHGDQEGAPGQDVGCVVLRHLRLSVRVRRRRPARRPATGCKRSRPSSPARRSASPPCRA